MAQGLASILRMWGHNVRTAHDGAAALEVAAQFAPEVVLLDLGLPRVDGLEVARRLRQAPEHTPTLMVSMSGFGQEQARRHSGGRASITTSPSRSTWAPCAPCWTTVCVRRAPFRNSRAAAWRITFPQAGNKTSENADHRRRP